MRASVMFGVMQKGQQIVVVVGFGRAVEGVLRTFAGGVSGTGSGRTKVGSTTGLQVAGTEGGVSRG